MTERLPHPVDYTSVLLQHLGRLDARRNEQRIEQCAPLTLEMVVRHEGSRFRCTSNLSSPRSNDERGSRSKFHRSPNLFDGVPLKTVSDENRDPPRFYQRLLWHEFHLRDLDGPLLVTLALGCWGDVASDVDRYGLGYFMVDLIQLRNGVLVDERVVAVAELERDGIDQVLLLNRRKRIVEELCLIVVLLELGSASAKFHAVHLLSELVVPSLAFVRGRNRVVPIRPVVQALGDPGLMLAVSDMIEHRAHRAVYRKLQSDMSTSGS